MRFVDKVRIVVKAGTGGNGCLSFLREKYRPHGGPDGGDGGRGGSVFLEADPELYTLLDFVYRPHLTARDGNHGKGKDKTGATAEDLTVRVPVGTVVYKDGRILADLSEPGGRVLAAAGGRGGRGNASFKSQRNTSPRLYEKGQPGEENELQLELKLIADVGLAGFPNAGKSTLLARVSNARPKIADYPFTTLAPHLGLVQHKERSFLMADVPGLIEGAHQGKGLGGDFLRHVERTRLIVHLIDPMGYDRVPAEEGIRVIEGELKSYSRTLGRKPRLLVLSKADLPEAEEALRRIRARYRSRKVYRISAATGEGVSELLDVVLQELRRLPLERLATPRPGESTVKVAPGFHILRTGPGAFQVSGRYVERVVSMTDFTLLEPLHRLQKAFRRIGLDRALKAAGVREGDRVTVGELEFDWSDAPLRRPPKLSPTFWDR